MRRRPGHADPVCHHRPDEPGCAGVFAAHRDLACLPVTEQGKPIGLINRSIFLSQMSKPYHRELYNRKSCIAFMDKEPLIVDAAMSIDALTFRTVEYGEKALADGFIIARDGQYIGLGKACS
jgi:hypothetical protein